MLDDLGILATLSWFFRRFQAAHPKIAIEQKIVIGEENVPDSLKTSIFRITQEAMNNIVKHSQADSVSLSLNCEGGRMELRIQDNGIGFDLEETHSRERSERGLGLESMRERVELSGGSLTVESAKGRGTLIRASWPC
jgi:signal transduction histidine kinase